MKKHLLRTLTVFSAISMITAANIAEARTPEAGSTERKKILNALRPSIETKIGPNVEFVIQKIEVADDWAFIQAMPQRKGGKQINGRSYFDEQELEEMDGLTVTALLRYQNGRWNLVDKAIGATDAWYCGVSAAHAVTHCH